ncbi:MAG: response regulator [Pseudomonadota bacterium]
MLDDVSILIVEDEALIALDLTMTLEDEGLAVIGPCTNVRSALENTSAADAAILDVDLKGEAVFPVADRLAQSGTPFLFHTGRKDVDILRDRYGDVPIIEKPTTPKALMAGVTGMLRA